MENKKEPEIVFSRTVKAGKRIYYLDVKKARNEDLYICITESKRMQGASDQLPNFEKHKLFLYKEDFAHFTEGLEDVIGYIKNQLGEIEERPLTAPESIDAQPIKTVSEPQNPTPVFSSEPAEQTVVQSPEKRRFGFFSRKNS